MNSDPKHPNFEWGAVGVQSDERKEFLKFLRNISVMRKRPKRVGVQKFPKNRKVAYLKQQSKLILRNNHWSQLRSVDQRNTDLGRFSVNRSGNHPESVRVDLRTDLSRFSTTQPSVVKTDLNSSGQCRATLSNVLLRRAAYIKTCRER